MIECGFLSFFPAIMKRRFNFQRNLFSSLPQPLNNAGPGDLAVQQRRYRHSQEDEERINHRHGPHNKLIGEEPNSTGNSLYDYHRKQHTENSWWDHRSHNDKVITAVNSRRLDSFNKALRKVAFAFFKLELEIACGGDHKVRIYKFSDILVNIKAAGQGENLYGNPPNKLEAENCASIWAPPLYNNPDCGFDGKDYGRNRN